MVHGQARGRGGTGAREAWQAGLEVSDSVPSTRSRLVLALDRYDEVVGLTGTNLLAPAMAAARLRQRA